MTPLAASQRSLQRRRDSSDSSASSPLPFFSSTTYSIRIDCFSMGEFLLNAGAGSIGAIAGIIIGSPLDVIKTQMQAGKAPAGRSAFSLFRSSLASPRAMFKGVGASALSMAPNNFVMFGSYGSAMEALQSSAHSESWSHLARVGAAGSLGGFLQSFVVSPFELVKVQQQTNSEGRPPSALSSVRHIVQQHGPAGLWRGMFLFLPPLCSMRSSSLLLSGLSAILVRDTPTFGAYFVVYEAMVDATAKAMTWRGAGQPPPTQADSSKRVLWTSQLVGGAAAGLACWTLALPMDVVKSVVQAAPLNEPAPSIASAASSVYHRAGMAGFWAGAGPCLLRSVPTNAVTFFVFEYIKEYATRS